jgi:hypothetical protein
MSAERSPARLTNLWTCKDLLTLERHGARTLPGLRERIRQRLLCLAARHLPEPPTRPAKPLTRQLLRLIPVESIV